MLTGMESARNHINLETCVFEDDEVSRGFSGVLMNKQRQGVQVNMIRSAFTQVARSEKNPASRPQLHPLGTSENLRNA